MVSALHLPLDVSRCSPDTHHCPQCNACARANDKPEGLQFATIDASICLPFGTCPIFIDMRAIALKEAA